MYHTFFIYSSVDGHLDCFHDLAIVNNVTVSTGVHVSLELWFQDICLILGLLSHMVVPFLVIYRTCILLSIVGVSIYFPPTVQESSLIPTPSPTFVIGGRFSDGHSYWCELLLQCSFNLHFSNN